MEPGTIQKTILIFQDAFRKLGIHASVDTVEDLAIVVDHAMNLSARSFHTPEHVFKLTNLPDPIQALAALFHDVVYYQVDQGFSREIWSIVSPYIMIRDDLVFLSSAVDPEEKLFTLTLEVFGFKPGDQLFPSCGLNEFLSTVVAVKKLEGILTTRDMLKIIVCIEATIPFRGPTEEGLEYGEASEGKLAAISEKYGLELTGSEIEEIVRLAVIFSNKDVESFAECDASRFLDDTWKLLPESNVSLQNGLYSIKEYRKALQRTEGFLWSLNSERIFKQYRGIPDTSTYLELVRRSQENLCIGREYLGIKLLAMAILEALAEMTGGDAPIALFMGKIRRGDEVPVRMEDFLPIINDPFLPLFDTAIYRLLADGRASEADFDMRNSPYSLYLYEALGPEQIQVLLAQAKEMFVGEVAPEMFLASIEYPVLEAIIQATANLATTRRETMLALLNNFQ